jgi:hypothetical protein
MCLRLNDFDETSRCANKVRKAGRQAAAGVGLDWGLKEVTGSCPTFGIAATACKPALLHRSCRPLSHCDIAVARVSVWRENEFLTLEAAAAVADMKSGGRVDGCPKLSHFLQLHCV